MLVIEEPMLQSRGRADIDIDCWLDDMSFCIWESMSKLVNRLREGQSTNDIKICVAAVDT